MGLFGSDRYNRGRSWHLDRQKFNTQEDWEKPMKNRKRKYFDGGSTLRLDYDKEMALNNLDMIHDYSVAIDKMVSEEAELEEWVKMKMTRIEQNVADVKHALEAIENYGEGGMIFKKQLLHIAKYATEIKKMIEGGTQLMSWQEDKLAVSAEYIDNLYHHLDYKMGNRASQFGWGGSTKYADGGDVAYDLLWDYLEDTAYQIVPVGEGEYLIYIQHDATVDEVENKLQAMDSVVIGGMTIYKPFEVVGVDADAGQDGRTAILVETDIEKFKRGGGVKDHYNRGRSWHQDRAKYNKNEDWEIPMNQRGGKGKSSRSGYSKSNKGGRGYEYIPNIMIREADVENKGKMTNIDGADILDGIYVKAGTKFATGGGVEYSNDENEVVGNFLLNTKEGRDILSKSKNSKQLERNVRDYHNLKGIPNWNFGDDDDDGIDWVTWNDLMNEIKGKYSNGGGVGENMKDNDYVGDYLADDEPKMVRTQFEEEEYEYKRGGKVKNYKYVPNYMLDSVTVERNGKETEISADRILDGLYVKGKVKFAHGGVTSGQTMQVRMRMSNGMISTDSLKNILGHEPNYPVQIVGGLKLEKCFLKPYYKLA